MTNDATNLSDDRNTSLAIYVYIQTRLRNLRIWDIPISLKL